MEDDLQQEIAEFVLERGEVAAVDRIGHFIGFLDRVRRDAGEILFEVPRAAAFAVAQAGHDGEQCVDVARVGGFGHGWRTRRGSPMMPQLFCRRGSGWPWAISPDERSRNLSDGCRG